MAQSARGELLITHFGNAFGSKWNPRVVPLLRPAVWRAGHSGRFIVSFGIAPSRPRVIRQLGFGYFVRGQFVNERTSVLG